MLGSGQIILNQAAVRNQGVCVVEAATLETTSYGRVEGTAGVYLDL